MIAKVVRVHLARNEWGNEKMHEVAQECFQAFSEADVVTVYEHAGWALSWNRAGLLVGTANDGAAFSEEQLRYRASIEDVVQLAEIRRQVAPMGDALLV